MDELLGIITSTPTKKLKVVNKVTSGAPFAQGIDPSSFGGDGNWVDDVPTLTAHQNASLETCSMQALTTYTQSGVDNNATNSDERTFFAHSCLHGRDRCGCSTADPVVAALGVGELYTWYQAQPQPPLRLHWWL